MNIELELQKLGFTRGESLVYLALIEIGSSSIGAILTKSGVSNSKVYGILERLSKKGFVSVIIKNGKKIFEAKAPSRILQYLDLEEEEIKNKKKNASTLIDTLNQLQNQTISQDAEILQGLAGIKTFCEIVLDSMSSDETFYILGAPSAANEMLGGYFQEWHKRRTQKSINCKVLFNANSKKWAERRSKSPLTHIKFLPDEIVSPVMIDISKEYVATIIFTQKPICIVIRNEEVAKSYINYFELLWKQSHQ